MRGGVEILFPLARPQMSCLVLRDVTEKKFLMRRGEDEEAGIRFSSRDGSPSWRRGDLRVCLCRIRCSADQCSASNKRDTGKKHRRAVFAGSRLAPPSGAVRAVVEPSGYAAFLAGLLPVAFGDGERLDKPSVGDDFCLLRCSLLSSLFLQKNTDSQAI